MTPENARLISVARGQSPADLLFRNARVVNTFNGETETGNIAVAGALVAGVGDYTEAERVIDLDGAYVIPGLIDGHVHLESSLLDVGQYARAVVPHGTLAIVTDLHEIANVAGTTGMRYVLDYARRLPLDLFLMAPSCVPATHLETAGATITAADIGRMLKWRGCIGLGEVMNFPGVLMADEGVLRKIGMARGKIIDGHAPGLSGKDLSAYVAAGISSDHESVTLAEAREKLSRGLYLMIREGSSEKNLESLLPAVTDDTWPRCFFVVDDKSCADLVADGDLDGVVRKAVSLGLSPVRAVQMATINTARYFRLEGLGAVAPGYYANLLVLKDLESLSIDSVYYRGREVARSGEPFFSAAAPRRSLAPSMNVKPFGTDDLSITARAGSLPVIEVVAGQIVTGRSLEKVHVTPEGRVLPNVSRDLLKMVVVERHHATGNIGRCLIRGFGIKRGAIASSVAHDCHNIVAVGTNDEDILVAVREVERLGGGLAAAAGLRVAGSLALPIAGLLSREPLETVAAALEHLEEVVRGMGSALPAPFATLSFMALPVIPELKLTDLGLVDVLKFALVGE